MKRFGTKILSLLLTGVIVAPVLSVFATTPTDTVWDSGVSTVSMGAISSDQATGSPHCQTEQVRHREVHGVVTKDLNATPRFNSANEKLTAGTSECVTQNQHGLFTTGGSYSPSGDPYKMIKILPDTPGLSYTAVPQSSVVITNSNTGSGGSNIVINYNFPFIGKLDVERRKTNVYELAWNINQSSDILKYKSGEVVMTHGYEFSSTGKYMVVRLGSVLAKVDLRTQLMTPFYYRSIWPTVTGLGISPDGRYVLSAANDQILIHDTLACELSYQKDQWVKQTTPLRYTGCVETHNYHADVVAAVGTYSRIQKVDFSPNGSQISFAVGKSSGSSYTWKRAAMTANNYTSSVEGYIAFGDSYSAGEGDLGGDEWYEPGTDDQGNKDTFDQRNLCHLSRRSYPYLIAKVLGYLSGSKDNPTTPLDTGLFHSVACSGAVIPNVIGRSEYELTVGPHNEDRFANSDNQYRNDYLAVLGRWQPGRIKQQDVLEPDVFGGLSATENKPEVITLGIGGNDAGFGDHLKACSMNPVTCKQAVPQSRELADLLVSIAGLKDELKNTYTAIKTSSPDSRLYVHGYPQFVSSGDSLPIDTILNGHQCGLNVPLDRSERQMVIAGVDIMNKTIRAAAKEAGVFYVDVQDILQAGNLCSAAADTDMLVNGLTAGNDAGFITIGGKTICLFGKTCMGKESFHPNPNAHKLYQGAMLDQTDNLTAPMPRSEPAGVVLPDTAYSQEAATIMQQLSVGGDIGRLIPSYKQVIHVGSAGDTSISLKNLLPGSQIKVFIYSTPTLLGEATVIQDGTTIQQLLLPQDIEPGAHEVHVLATTSAGEQVEYYQLLFIGHSTDDFDGDGILNSRDSCQTMPSSLIDQDTDGMDDACDPQILATKVGQHIKGEQDSETQHEPESDNYQNGQVLGASTNTQSLQQTGDNLALYSFVVGMSVAVAVRVVASKNGQGKYRI